MCRASVLAATSYRRRWKCRTQRLALWSVGLLALLSSTTACSGAPAPPPAAEVAALQWDSVLSMARGTTVAWRMWRGDPSINAYVDRWVAPRLRDRYGITLNAFPGQGPEIINELVVEREAGVSGSADLVWINGETFSNLRAEGLLGGPWAHRLPNAVLVDSASPVISRDFEQDPAGYESPWGRVQFALIYDTVRTPEPPRTFAELADWIRAHPGRFTHDQQFTGMTFLKMLMYARAGGVEAFQGGFDEARYRAGSARVWEWLDEARSSFWRGGEAYPPGVADLHRLFANREVDFSMSNNHNEVVTKVRQGILPPTARALLLRDGTIANSHYLGIPYNAPNPAGAMVVADFLLSPEAQLEKLRPEVWADGTVLDVERLPPRWRRRFAAAEADPRSLPRDSLARYARPEVAPRYHERLSEDWRARVRRGP
ncbi:MAG: ABC transporter substrate-binding protein [Gemmatimonadetes bacterium]|nr:ABC transporter substrate-binding protein [Gemmatimonadota bacterium]